MTRSTEKKRLSALDRSFLAAEGRDTMMHVGGLLQFSRPDDVTPHFFSKLREEAMEVKKVGRPWNLKLLHPQVIGSPLQAWVPDESFDIDYHIRRSGLAFPGDERELGVLVSRLHGTPVDFHRPPWEAHFIEGLASKRIALYVKVHHALVDGYTGMRLLQRSFSTDRNDHATPLFFEPRPESGARRAREEREETAAPTLDSLLHLVRDQVGAAKSIGRALMSVARAVRSDDRSLTLPLSAPKSTLNRPITRSRRFATSRVETAKMKAIAHAAGGTLNDVVLCIVGSSLRRYLLEQGTLPDKPLVAMVPVNVRPKDDPGGGNAVGAVLASLATDAADPKKRLETIIASTQRAKATLQGMSKNAIIQYSALVLAPLMLSFVPGIPGRVRPAFNVVVSNVPGPDTPLYFRGFKLEELYPLSIPFHGYGLNITLQSYAGWLDFGFTGCRDTVPHLQRLAVHSVDAAAELEKAYGLA
jgi:WS/DGAT/MGAT family acyltransferase